MEKEYSVGLDIGTKKIVVIVGVKNNHGIAAIRMKKNQSLGVYEGIINDIYQVSNSIKNVVNEAKVSIPSKKITVGITGKHIRSLKYSNYIIRENTDNAISENDIEQLLEQTRKLIISSEEEIIHIIPQEYKVDFNEKIQNPVGMYGKRIEAKFHIVLAKKDAIKNITNCLKEAGLEVENFILGSLASSEAVLRKEEKEEGVAVIDIGEGIIDMAIFKNNIIRYTSVIHYGGGIITEDIKENYSITEKSAEYIKKTEGSAIPNLEEVNEKYIDAEWLPEIHNKKLCLLSLENIINTHIEEMLNLINAELEHYGASQPKNKLISGIVLTGGGANLKHISTLLNQKTGLNVRIGFANEYIVNDKNQKLKGPEFATTIGLLIESIKVKEQNALKVKQNPAQSKNIFQKWIQSIFEWIKKNFNDDEY